MGNRGEQVAEFHLGPTFSFKGIANPTCYRLVADQPRCYMDYTGTGNSVNAEHPQVLKLIMDSLRYRVLEMHVDGFRFDLAATLAAKATAPIGCPRSSTSFTRTR